MALGTTTRWDMSRVHIEFDVELPKIEATTNEVEEWLRFNLHDNGCMKMNNPLEAYEVEPIFGTFNWDQQ